MVIEHEGEYFLQHASDWHVEHNRRIRQRRLQTIDSTLEKRIEEAKMLKRFYHTHDTQEIVAYATKEIFEDIVYHVRQHNNCTLQKATDIVTESTELFLRRITTGTLPTVSIGATIRAMCRKVIRQNGKKREYNDNMIIKKDYDCYETL